MNAVSTNGPSARMLPLKGLKVVELAGLGPVPFAGMMLADQGADVVFISRPDAATSLTACLERGRRVVAADLKQPQGREQVLRELQDADILLEGFRPGVMERLGLGPADCHAIRPSLVYGRMTGWGQTGPLAPRAGHDLNYLALSGMLWPMGDANSPPRPPLNLVADFGGGAMLLLFGVLAGVWQARASGKGCVVDAAMTEGSALLGTLVHGLMASGQWSRQRDANLLDGAAPFYRCYGTADGRWVSVAAIEPPFFKTLVLALGMEPAWCERQYAREHWPALQAEFERIFAAQSRDHWDAVLLPLDACYAPVLDPIEAASHPHAVARGSFAKDAAQVAWPVPAPRFSPPSSR